MVGTFLAIETSAKTISSDKMAFAHWSLQLRCAFIRKHPEMAAWSKYHHMTISSMLSQINLKLDYLYITCLNANAKYNHFEHQTVWWMPDVSSPPILMQSWLPPGIFIFRNVQYSASYRRRARRHLKLSSNIYLTVTGAERFSIFVSDHFLWRCGRLRGLVSNKGL